jgi:hypothetical protein
LKGCETPCWIEPLFNNAHNDCCYNHRRYTTLVLAPTFRQLEGYDVATFSQGNCPECSPLSCNHLATESAVNTHCLIASLDDAKTHLEDGQFNDSEPGPYRIIAVYTMDEITEQSVQPEATDDAVSNR